MKYDPLPGMTVVEFEKWVRWYAFPTTSRWYLDNWDFLSLENRMEIVRVGQKESGRIIKNLSPKGK